MTVPEFINEPILVQARFLADGGDNFTALRQGTDRLGGALDLDALVDYFAANSPVEPGSVDRITAVP